MSLWPLVLIIVSLVLVFTIIISSLLEKKLKKISFSIFLINSFSFLSYFFLFKGEEKVIEIIFITHSVLTVLALLFYLYLLIKKTLFLLTYEEKLTNSLKEINNSFYFITDRKEKVIKMTESFLTELGLDFEAVKGKNIFTLFNETIRVTNFDGVDTNTNALRVFYEDYRKTAKLNQIDERELLIQNYQGKSIYLTIVEQPLFYFNKYQGRINIGIKQEDKERAGLEGKLKNILADYESLRLKYIETLNLSTDGFYYFDLDQKTIWLSEVALKMLGLLKATFYAEDFYQYIHEDDLPSLLGSLSNLTKKKTSYKTRYRFLKGSDYLWLSDEGVRIFDDPNANIIIGKFTLHGGSQYSKLGNDEVDELKTEKEIYYHLQQLFLEKRTFQLSLFELINIPLINEEYGREVGNLLITEYVKKLKASFISESSEIFRLSGLVFAVTITDPRKMDLLRSGLLKDQEFLNLEMNYGAINVKMEIFLGVASSYKDAKEEHSLLLNAKKALKVARHQDFKLNVCYYGDLND